MRDLDQMMITSDLWLCTLKFRRPSEVADPGRPHTYLGVRFAVLGVSWGPGTEYLTHFSHRCVYTFSLPLPVLIRAVNHDLPFCDFSSEGDVAPFRDDTCHKCHDKRQDTETARHSVQK